MSVATVCFGNPCRPQPLLKNSPNGDSTTLLDKSSAINMSGDPHPRDCCLVDTGTPDGNTYASGAIATLELFRRKRVS